MVRFASVALLAIASTTCVFAKGQNKKKVCDKPIRRFSKMQLQLLYNAAADNAAVDAVKQLYKEDLKVGSIMELLAEANDASQTQALVEDGKSGDINFPFGNLKPIATVGEVSVCPESEGELIVGKPDGLGAYLYDDQTVRVVVQSESYGQIQDGESYPFSVNDGAATFTGSHVQYVDYDREGLSQFMSRDKPASEFVTGMGEVITEAYNLEGDKVGPRDGTSATTKGAHYSNTNAAGEYRVDGYPSRADWLMQSLCSAHLEEKHQWGPGIGLEDGMFITNEEWINYDLCCGDVVGISAHAVDLKTGEAWAFGSVTNSGFEKIVEINPQNKDIVVLAPAGYNGDFKLNETHLLALREAYAGPRKPRSDGSWVFPRNILPARVYIGVKGKMEDGSDGDDFLARNGLRYGKMYGFAIDMSKSGPTKGLWRDKAHIDAPNGFKVRGKWIAIDWTWDGKVKNFETDGAWEFQTKPPRTNNKRLKNYYYWNGAGNNQEGNKTEHNSPDLREGMTGFFQGSTAGYIGHYIVKGTEHINVKSGLPNMLDGQYYVLQGKTDVTGQIELGGAGLYADGTNARTNVDKDGVKTSLNDVDGLEAIKGCDGKMYLIVQEDSGNIFGERMLISSPLGYEGDELTWYFVAMSGGANNTRMTSGVGIPKGTSLGAKAHEFSGIADMSGLLYKKQNGNFALKANNDGYLKRLYDSMTCINDKDILIALQGTSLGGGIIGALHADRGGQWYVYKPNLP